MAITVTAAGQTGRRVAVSVAGLSTAAPAVSSLTLFRDDLDQPRTPVRGFVGYVPTTDGFVAFDNEAPLERPVFYTLQTVRSDGSIVEQTTAAPVILDAAYPAISEPVTGESVELSAIVSWPALERVGRAAVVDVVDRPDPIVVSQGLSSPSSTITVRTDSIVARRALRGLLESSQVLQVRDPHPDVEDAYVATGKVSERRVTLDPTDPRREIVLDVRHVGAPALGVASGGDTLQELADAFPVLTGNMVTNPGAEIDTSGWGSNDPSHLTLSRTTAQAHRGAAAFQLVANAVGYAFYQSTAVVLAPGVYSTSLWVKGPAGAAFDHAWIAQPSNVNIASGTDVLTGAWQRVTFTGTMPAGTTSAYLAFYVPVGTTYVDDVSVVAGATPRDLFGTLGEIADAFPGTLLDIASADLAAF